MVHPHLGERRGSEAAILFGKYELLERINVGGMAEIVKARDTSVDHGPLVAVKRILPHLVDDEQFVAMFLDESRMLSSLRHEHIIRTLDVGVADGTPYLALELVDGKDARMLFHRMRRHGFRLPLPVACYIMARVCDGLHYAHEYKDAEGRSLGLVHRDVSLQNILLSYTGDVKVTDFGIAMSANNLAHTQTGVVKGKFGYMSPEQIRGKLLDRRTDIFSAGICLYELLTAHRLFSSETDYESMVRVRNVDIVPPRQVNPDIPEELERILLRSLAKTPDDRFASAAEMADALQEFTIRNDCEVIAEDLGNSLVEAFAAAVEGSESMSAASGGWRSAEEATGLGAFTDLQAASELTAFPYIEDAPPPMAPSLPVGAVGGAAAIGFERRTAAGMAMPTPASGVALRQGAPGALQVPNEDTDDEDDDVTSQLPVEREEALLAVELSVLENEARGQAEEDVRRRELDVSSAETAAGTVEAPVLASEPPPVPPTPAKLASSTVRAVQERGDRSATIKTLRPALEPAQTGGQGFKYMIGGLLLLGLVALGYMASTRDSDRASIHLVTEPVDVQVAVDGLPIGANGSPFLVQDLEPGKPHRIEVSKAGYRPWMATLTVGPGAVLEVPIVRLAPAGARQDGEGAAPESEPSRGAGGRSATPDTAGSDAPDVSDVPDVVEGSGVSPEQGRRDPLVEGEDRQRADSAAEAAKSDAVAGSSGMLHVDGPPGQVFANGVLLGRTPELEAELPQGRHRIRWVSRDGGPDKVFGVKIPGGRTIYRVVEAEEPREPDGPLEASLSP